MTCATGFCNAISILILRREPSPLPVASGTDRFYDGRAPGLSVQNRTNLPDTL